MYQLFSVLLVNLQNVCYKLLTTANYNHLTSGPFNRIYSIVNDRLLPISVHYCLVFPIFKMKVSSLNILTTLITVLS